MRRRERLTGFLIIFMLLTFSAYSNSMNIGGRAASTPASFSPAESQMEYVQGRQKLSLSRKKENKMSRDLESSIETENAEQQGDNSKSENNLLNKNLNNKAQLRKDENKVKKVKNENKSVFGSQADQASVLDKKRAAEKELARKRKEEKLINKIKLHKVKSGETLWDIAHHHGLNIDSLIGANNISNMNNIKPGQEFKILPVKGIIYRVSPGESIASISEKFNLKKEIIIKDNDLQDTALKIDQKLILRGAKPEFSYQDRLDQKFMYPINTRITSYYGPRWGRIHEGLDFAAPMGSPIRCVSSGRVVYSGWASGYGKVVIIEHQRGLRTLYAHNSKLLVRSGESVGRGEVISRSGNTGNSTGPHLHFEVQVNGRPENPLNYIHR